jgi:hypothetical protein
MGQKVLASFLPTYRRVISMVEDGHGFNEIARRLNAEGVPTSRPGGQWYASTVRAIVTSKTARNLA